MNPSKETERMVDKWKLKMRSLPKGEIDYAWQFWYLRRIRADQAQKFEKPAPSLFCVMFLLGDGIGEIWPTRERGVDFGSRFPLFPLFVKGFGAARRSLAKNDPPFLWNPDP